MGGAKNDIFAMVREIYKAEAGKQERNAEEVVKK